MAVWAIADLHLSFGVANKEMDVFGDKWRHVGRATDSHSALSIGRYSSSRFAPARIIGGRTSELLDEVPEDVRVRLSAEAGGCGLIAGHDGYADTHGLTHVRAMDLSANGRGMALMPRTPLVSHSSFFKHSRTISAIPIEAMAR